MFGVGVGIVLMLSAAGAPTPTRAAGGTVVSHGDRHRPWIALTFDDGIDPANCRRILAILVDEQVTATFFPLAEAMPLDPDFWRLDVRAGDPVGDHTLTHPQMPRLSGAAQLREITAARDLGESILGRSMLRVFRPPYGAYDARTVAASVKAGFGTVLLWDVSDRDTSRRGSVAKMLAAGTSGRNGSVVLMHCGPNATPYLLRPLIESYRTRGFQFVTIPKLLGLPWTTEPTTPPSPADILDGLSPFPATDSGGPITGPNGYALAPAAQPAPSSAPLASSEPAASSSPTASSAPAPSSAPAASAALGIPSVVPTTGAADLSVSPANPGPSAAPDHSPAPDDGGGTRAMVVGLVAILAGVGGATLVARRRRSL